MVILGGKMWEECSNTESILGNILVMKNNNVISVGSTSINGRPHAEDNAINFCSSNLFL